MAVGEGGACGLGVGGKAMGGCLVGLLRHIILYGLLVGGRAARERKVRGRGSRHTHGRGPGVDGKNTFICMR